MAFRFLRRKVPRNGEDSIEQRPFDANTKADSKWVKPEVLRRSFFTLSFMLVSDVLLALSALAFLALAAVVYALNGVPTASNDFGQVVVNATRYVCSLLEEANEGGHNISDSVCDHRGTNDGGDSSLVSRAWC